MRKSAPKSPHHLKEQCGPSLTCKQKCNAVHTILHVEGIHALVTQFQNPYVSASFSLFSCSMSLQHATRTGNTLPIGMAVCGNCKDKHLKEIDFGDSRQLEPDAQSSSETVEASLQSIASNPKVMITSVAPDSHELAHKGTLKVSMTAAPTSNASVTISRARSSGNSIEIKCIEPLPKSEFEECMKEWIFDLSHKTRVL